MFDLAMFEARLAVAFITSDELPALAADALEAGYDGQSLVRMAILDPKHGWLIDQVLPGMLTDLGAKAIGLTEAALRVGCAEAKRILDTETDPLASQRFFWRLWIASGYAEALYLISNLDDDPDFYSAVPEVQRELARIALREFVSTIDCEQQTTDHFRGKTS